MAAKSPSKSKPAASKAAKPPARPARPAPELVTGDLGPHTSIHSDLAAGLGVSSAKAKPAPVVAPEPVPSVPAERAFSDPAPPPPEPVVVSSPNGPTHRANCDPPSRT